MRLRRREAAEDLILLDWVGIDLVVVHGGGRQITQMLDRVGQQATFVDGQRVTDAPTLEVVEMVRGRRPQPGAGPPREPPRRRLGRPHRLRRRPGQRARIAPPRAGPGRRRRGRRPRGDRSAARRRTSVVVAPLATGPDGTPPSTSTVDVFAARLAQALGAFAKLVLLTDIAGVLDRDRRLIGSLTDAEARALIAQGMITGGRSPRRSSRRGRRSAAGVTDPHHRRPARARPAARDLAREGVGTQVVTAAAAPARPGAQP
ncbi:MAG: hypothetical protein HS111_14960 [Kofleriaceae bacterium]|nr:hypothetical protein [Kofleriaceae bacterium]